jgi:hypothetical protein
MPHIDGTVLFAANISRRRSYASPSFPRLRAVRRAIVEPPGLKILRFVVSLVLFAAEKRFLTVIELK